MTPCSEWLIVFARVDSGRSRINCYDIRRRQLNNSSASAAVWAAILATDQRRARRTANAAGRRAAISVLTSFSE